MSRFALPPEHVLRAREKLVLDHFHDEVRQDWDATLSTFPHPLYELIPLLRVHDGDAEVRGYYHDTRVAFPDQDHEIIDLRHSHDGSSSSSGCSARTGDRSARSPRPGQSTAPA